MARYRAGYDQDFGLRDFDNRRPRRDVGSHGYDRGYRSGGGGRPFDRPWVGGYRDGFQGGSGGIGVGTSGHAMQSNWDWEHNGHDYDPTYRDRESYRRSHGGWQGRDAGGSGGVERGRYVRGARGGYDTGYHGYDREYREDLERNRPRFSPVGGMHPSMGGSYVNRGDRAWPGGWNNEWSRWF